VSVISDSTNQVVATVQNLTSPYGVSYDPSTGEVFVTNWGASSVSVISDSTNQVVATVPVQPNPLGVLYDPAKGQLFVTDAGDSLEILSEG